MPCELEPPVYKVYRQQYFGYFPTCWRKFPPGWGWVTYPMIPSMPVNMGMLIVLATVVIGAYGGLAWWRNNL